MGFLIGRFAGWPIVIHVSLPLVLTFQIVGSDLPDDRAADDESVADVSAGPAQSIFHSIMFPTIHCDTFKSIRSSAEVTDFRRASGHAGSHDEYQSSPCVP
jgi:hypothetical protein